MVIVHSNVSLSEDNRSLVFFMFLMFLVAPMCLVIPCLSIYRYLYDFIWSNSDI